VVRRTLIIAAGALALVVILVVGLRQASDDRGEAEPGQAMTRAEVLAPLQAPPPAPPRLAALHEQGSELIPGGLPRYEAQLRELRGFPVVVNLWASWCAPCRFELPFLQEVASEQGKEIAFLGVDVGDEREAAKRTAEEFFMPYPSIEDPRTKIRADLGAQGLPATAFYDERGKLEYLHQGAYRTADDLRADIRRYARGGS
jgi:thiol-disulfide isomerase/thioredoxin